MVTHRKVKYFPMTIIKSYTNELDQEICTGTYENVICFLYNNCGDSKCLGCTRGVHFTMDIDYFLEKFVEDIIITKPKTRWELISND